MRKVWIIARHEYLTNLRRAGFIIWTLAVPVIGLIGLLVAALAGGQASNMLEQMFTPEIKAIGFVDRSGLFTPVLPEYSATFIPYTDEASGRDDLAARTIDTLLVIPADYLDTGRVEVISRESNPNFSVMEYAEDFLSAHLLHGRVDPAIATRVTFPMDPVMRTLSESGEAEASGQGVGGVLLSFMVPYFLGILLATSIFTASGYLLRSVSQEKSSRVIEIVLSSCTASELLAGKVIGLGALGLTQIGVWLTAAFLLSGGSLGLLGIAIPLLSQPRLFILSVVYYLLGFLLYAVLMASAGSLGATEQESQQIAGVFSLVAVLPMMVIGFVFNNPNALIARILSWIPLTAPTMMMLRMTLGEIPLIDILGSIVLCLISIPAVLWAGAKVFRTGLLMYGKRPDFKEIWRLLRQA